MIMKNTKIHDNSSNAHIIEADREDSIIEILKYGIIHVLVLFLIFQMKHLLKSGITG